MCTVMTIDTLAIIPFFLRSLFVFQTKRERKNISSEHLRTFSPSRLFKQLNNTWTCCDIGKAPVLNCALVISLSREESYGASHSFLLFVRTGLRARGLTVCISRELPRLIPPPPSHSSYITSPLKNHPKKRNVSIPSWVYISIRHPLLLHLPPAHTRPALFHLRPVHEPNFSQIPPHVFLTLSKVCHHASKLTRIASSTAGPSGTHK